MSDHGLTVIDPKFLKFFDRIDNLKKDFQYIERELKKRNSYGYVNFREFSV